MGAGAGATARRDSGVTPGPPDERSLVRLPDDGAVGGNAPRPQGGHPPVRRSRFPLPLEKRRCH